MRFNAALFGMGLLVLGSLLMLSGSLVFALTVVPFHVSSGLLLLSLACSLAGAAVVVGCEVLR